MSTSSPRRVTWQSVMVRTVSPWAAAEEPAAHRARKSWAVSYTHLVQLSSGDSVPQWLGWLNNDTVLAVYENCAVVYGAAGGERGRFDLGGGSQMCIRDSCRYLERLRAAGCHRRQPAGTLG